MMITVKARRLEVMGKSLAHFGFQFDSGNEELGPKNKETFSVVYKVVSQVSSYVVI